MFAENEKLTGITGFADKITTPKSPVQRPTDFVDVHLKPNSAQFVVGDDGPGFDNEETLNNRPDDCLESGANRGSVLMRALMDKVSYNDLSNRVTLVKDVNFVCIDVTRALHWAQQLVQKTALWTPIFK